MVIYPSLLTFLAKFATMGSVSPSWKLLASQSPGLSVVSFFCGCPWVVFRQSMIELLSVQATIISYPDIAQLPSYCFLLTFVLIRWHSLFLCIPASAHVMGTSSGLVLLQWNKCWLTSTLSPFLVPLTWMLHKVMIRAKVIVQHGVLFLPAQTVRSIHVTLRQHLLLFSPPSMW